ncbi:MAG: hypothetical protein ABR875_01370 [Minisyncoccia bacterium]|jgi:hypothetical protein
MPDLEKEDLDAWLEAMNEMTITRVEMLGFSSSAMTLSRAGFCRMVSKNTKFCDDLELRTRVLELLADEDVDVRAAACQTVLDLNLDASGYWVRIHKDETRDCIRPSRMWQLVYNPTLTAEEERAHIKSCRYCKRSLKFMEDEKTT